MAEHVLPLAVAHRGGNEVAHENTLEAFQDAIDVGYRRIETDVHFTRHGDLLAVHGQTIDGSEALQIGTLTPNGKKQLRPNSQSSATLLHSDV